MLKVEHEVIAWDLLFWGISQLAILLAGLAFILTLISFLPLVSQLPPLLPQRWVMFYLHSTAPSTASLFICLLTHASSSFSSALLRFGFQSPLRLNFRQPVPWGERRCPKGDYRSCRHLLGWGSKWLEKTVEPSLATILLVFQSERNFLISNSTSTIGTATMTLLKPASENRAAMLGPDTWEGATHHELIPTQASSPVHRAFLPAESTLFRLFLMSLKPPHWTSNLEENLRRGPSMPFWTK